MQRIYAQQLAIQKPSDEQIEQRGRLLGMLDLVQWASRRAVPVLDAPVAGSHARRMLEAIVATPGITGQALVARLGVDKSEVSRTGSRLLDAGLATRRRNSRHAHWTVTPRGRAALRTSPPPLSKDAASGELDEGAPPEPLTDRARFEERVALLQGAREVRRRAGSDDWADPPAMTS